MNAMRHAIAKMQRAERSVYPQDKALTRFPHQEQGFLLGRFSRSRYVMKAIKIALIFLFYARVIL
jgi:hypothetical protein